jgi:hypothetical protein
MISCKQFRRKLHSLTLRYYLSIRREGLRKNTKNLTEDSRSPGRDLNPGPSKNEAGVLTTRPRHYKHNKYINLKKYIL